jgi:serine/threonine-protein kinase
MGEEKLTATGVSLGTPTYMSPEQGMADPNLDGRTDIYSLGCVLYEMLAGQPPFTGRTTQALIARHSLDQVPSISIVRQTIPEEVEDAILTALAKAPADRFSTAGAFAEALQACQQTGARTVRRTGRRTASRKRPTEKSWGAIAASVGVAVLVITGAAWAGKSFLQGRAAFAKVGIAEFRPQRVAVLYFKDLTPDKRLGYLADGLTESLTDELSHVNALDVISTGGISQFRGKDVRPDSIARALEAGTLVDGSVEADGDRVRATLRLVDGNSGAERDRVSIIEPLGNSLVLQSKLSEQLALMLREWLGNEIRVRALRTGTENPNAWSLVQRAEKARKDAAALDQSGKTAEAAAALAAADTMLAQAEVLDPKWPEPIVLRGAIAARQERMTADRAEAGKLIDVAVAHVDRAIALNSRDADALELRGSLRTRPIVRGIVTDQRKVEDLLRAAEQDLRASIAANPTQAGALNVLSAIKHQQHDPVESNNLAQRAYDADAYLTAAPEILWRLYVTSYDLEQFVNAQKWCNEAERRFPKHLVTARCQLWIMTSKAARADPAEAWRRAAEYERAVPPQQREYTRREAQIVVAAVLGRAGLADSARRVLVRARPTDPAIDPRGELMGYEAVVRTMLGDKKEAVDLLQRYLTDHPDHRRGFAKVNAWWWRPLQDDPRFKTLVATGD